MNKNDRLELLKQILLENEQEERSHLKKDIETLKTIVDDKTNELDSKLDSLEKNFNKKVSPVVMKQIRESRDEMVEVLFPVVGKLIQKFINLEFKLINERIEEQFDKIFTWEYLKVYFMSFFGGPKPSEVLLSKVKRTIVDQIFIIHKFSGIIIADTLEEEGNSDKDMIAGMLTAIKSFAEDTFDQKEDLQTIEYDNKIIFLFNYNQAYIATIISGILTQAFKAQWEQKLMDFSRETLTEVNENIQPQKQLFIQENLIKLIHETHNQ